MMFVKQRCLFKELQIIHKDIENDIVTDLQYINHFFINNLQTYLYFFIILDKKKWCISITVVCIFCYSL